jgi:hypothetical protein
MAEKVNDKERRAKGEGTGSKKTSNQTTAQRFSSTL